MITHIVQTRDSTLGWVDCRTAGSITEAERQATQLRTDQSPWMWGRIGEVRVVPVSESRCAAAYNR